MILVARPGKPTGGSQQQQRNPNGIEPFRDGRMIEDVTPVPDD